MSTNLEYRARESQRKEKVGGRPAKLNEKKGRQRSRAKDKKKKKKKKDKGDIFLLEEQRENFVAAVAK